jgi:tripartite-type tricarboxylate transporter receptor subunit TctC
MSHGWIFLVAVVSAFCSHSVFAQDVSDYPSKPVRIIIGSPAGGGTDVQTRLFAQKLSESIQRQFVVENHPGGSNTIAYGIVAKAVPDGYTLLSIPPGFTFVAALMKGNLPFDPIKDFTPISLLAKAPFLLLVHPSLPVKSVDELIKLARAKPGELALGVANGGSSHLTAAWFASMAHIKIILVPYKGTGQVVPDAIAGHLQITFGNVLAFMPYVKAGRLRALAVTSAERSAVLPDLPTIAESGLPGFDVITWAGWIAPARVPAAIITRLSAELAKVAKAPDIAQTLAQDGAEGVGSTPEQFGRLIATEIPRWRKVIIDTGMRVE